MKKWMYELAKTKQGLKNGKAHKRSVYGLYGVPGATRTPGLSLRRQDTEDVQKARFYRGYGLFSLFFAFSMLSIMSIKHREKGLIPGKC
ncbi:MAG: hypothetical protein Q4C12_06305 [Clostridia bacterium]|nr:hypothetical protein [Clostridia bacterium]